MTIKQIREALGRDTALKTITEAYGQIALIKLKRIRESTQQARIFFNQIAEVYSLVKASAKFTKKNVLPVKLCKIIITSNNRFYGPIDNQLIQFYLDQSNPNKEFTIVIGHAGSGIMKTRGFTKIQTVLFESDIPTPKDLSNLLANLTQYNRILVYFAQFKSVLTQTTTVMDITQSVQTNIKPSTAIAAPFILEPEAEEILTFFDTQIRQVLLEQTFLESELARTSSRLIFMDQAGQNAEKLIKDQKRLLYQAKLLLEDNSLLETISGLRRLT